MAVCTDCKQDMLTVTECTWQLIQVDGQFFLRSTERFDEQNGKCHDCNVVHGNVHHYGCDVERCPKCGGQLISCECRKGKLGKIIR